MTFFHQSHNLTMYSLLGINVNLLDPIERENDFINNCHSNFPIPLINKPTRNANNQSKYSRLYIDYQLYDTFNGIFFIRYNWSLSIANVAQSKKKKYLLQVFTSHRFLMLWWFRWIVNMNYFDSIRIALLPLNLLFHAVLPMLGFSPQNWGFGRDSGDLGFYF